MSVNLVPIDYNMCSGTMRQRERNLTQSSGSQSVAIWRGQVERTPYRDPKTERMTIAKMEITTLLGQALLDSRWRPRLKAMFKDGRSYQDQAFSADTTGFILS